MRPAFVLFALVAAAFASPVPYEAVADDVAVVASPADINNAYVDAEDGKPKLSTTGKIKACVAAVANEMNKHFQAACEVGAPST